MRFFVDSNIPMYVAGREHAFKAPSTAFLKKVAQGKVLAVSDVEVLQEILYRYFHTQEVEKGYVVFEAFAQTIPVIYPVFLEDMLEAKALLQVHQGLQPRDAVHAAVMLRRGLTTIVSYDQDFDAVPGIKRIEP